MTILDDKNIMKQWGTDSGLSREDTLSTITETKMAPVRDIHPLDRRPDIVIKPVGDEYSAFLRGKKDVNTALSNAAEKINQLILKENTK